MKQGFVLRIAPSGIPRVEEALQSNTLIIGWAEAKGLLNDALEWDEFREIVGGDVDLRKAGRAAGNMWRFVREMKVGDLVVVPCGPKFYVGKVSGPAFYDDTKVEEDTAYRRPVVWLNNKQCIPRSTAKSALLSRMKAYNTCVGATDLVDQIEECLDIAGRGEKPSFEKDLQDRLVGEALDELRSGRMENFGFERLVESVLRRLGAVETKVVPRREDKGIDIYATFLVAGTFRQVVGIQAKHFQPKPPIGTDVVRELIRGIEEGQETVTLGMIVTSGTFSDDAAPKAKAYEEENGIPIALVDGEQFAKLIVEHGFRKR